MLQAVAEAAAHDLARQVHLEPPHGNIAERRVGRVIRVDVDHLDDPVRVGARRRHGDVGQDRPGDRQVLVERFRLVDEDIVPSRREPLVLDLPQVPERGPFLGRKRHRVVGVAGVAVRTPGPGGLREGQRPVRPEKQRHRLDTRGRPTLMGPPHVRTGLEDECLGRRPTLRPPQMMLEERELHLPLEGHRGLIDELDAPQMVAQHPAPPAVQPRPRRKNVLGSRILRLDRAVDRHGAVEVLGVEPPRDVQDRVPDVAQVRQRVLPLPVLVVGVVLDEVVPGRDIAMEVQVIDVRGRARLHEEVVAGVGAVVEATRSHVGGRISPACVSG